MFNVELDLDIETFSKDQVTTGFNNSCLWQDNKLNLDDGPKKFDCERFVIDSTDQLWNMYRGIEVSKSVQEKILQKFDFLCRSCYHQALSSQVHGGGLGEHHLHGRVRQGVNTIAHKKWT